MDSEQIRKAVASAIWGIRREEEDRCDMDIDDIGSNHSVWLEADAAISAILESLVVELPESQTNIGTGYIETVRHFIETQGIRTK